MKRNQLFLLVPMLAVAALAGCELLVDFDRTKIPSDVPDGSTVTPVFDGSIDEPDADPSDAATDEDASPDSGAEDDAGDDPDASDPDTGTGDDGGSNADGGDAG